MDIFKNTTFDFLRWRWHALALSVLIILAGFGYMASRGGVPLGIDFSGGTIVVLKFQQPVTEEAVRAAVAGIPGEKVVQRYGQAGDNEILVRLPQTGREQGFSLEEGSKAILAAVGGANLGAFEVLSTEVVGPVIGADLQRKGIYATLASIAGIAIYIAIRFRPSFAIGAIVATFHDIFVTLAFLAFFGYELSLNVVAAILTIAGYSVNDTIVVFDRVRENLKLSRREPLDKVVNLSVNQTLARTVITAGTTFLAVLALFIFGGDVLHGFAFTMLVGIVSGTYSTVFIASAIAIILSQRKASAARAVEGGDGGARKTAAKALNGASKAADKPARKPARKGA
jgi:preprotein translocase subunit SecF